MWSKSAIGKWITVRCLKQTRQEKEKGGPGTWGYLAKRLFHWILLSERIGMQVYVALLKQNFLFGKTVFVLSDTPLIHKVNVRISPMHEPLYTLTELAWLQFSLLDLCLTETTADDTGNYTWTQTEKNITVSINCSIPVGAFATRSCMISKSRGAFWSAVDTDNCDSLDRTSTTAQLKSLTKVRSDVLVIPPLCMHSIQTDGGVITGNTDWYRKPWLLAFLSKSLFPVIKTASL